MDHDALLKTLGLTREQVKELTRSRWDTHQQLRREERAHLDRMFSPEALELFGGKEVRDRIKAMVKEISGFSEDQMNFGSITRPLLDLQILYLANRPPSAT